MRSFANLVGVTITSNGTGTFSLGPAATGYFGTSFLVDGGTYSYSVQQDSNVECGFGTYVASTNTLTRNVVDSTNANQPVDFSVGAVVAFTFLKEDIADLLAEAGGVGATAKAAFNAYGLQWGIWFNGTPLENELLALYSAPVRMMFQPSFVGAATAPPIVSPAADFIMTVAQQAGGTGPWTTIGTIELGTDGSVSLATVSASPTIINVGDRLRVTAPATADTSVAGFSCTLKGYIP